MVPSTILNVERWTIKLILSQSPTRERLPRESWNTFLFVCCHHFAILVWVLPALDTSSRFIDSLYPYKWPSSCFQPRRALLATIPGTLTGCRWFGVFFSFSPLVWRSLMQHLVRDFHDMIGGSVFILETCNCCNGVSNSSRCYSTPSQGLCIGNESDGDEHCVGRFSQPPGGLNFRPGVWSSKSAGFFKKPIECERIWKF